MTIHTIAINGMTCQHCVKAVASALSTVPGVVKATVSLEGKRATLEVEETEFSVEAARKAVVDEGYSVA